MSDIDVDVSLSSALSVEVALQQPINVPVTLAPNQVIEVGVVATGPQGLPGTDGVSPTIDVGTVTTGAAGTAVSVTNSGTDTAVVLDFAIPKGDTGSTGAAATISAGTTTNLAPGSSATVTNSGTTSVAIFDFGIPQGAVWYTGTGVPSATHNNGDLYLNTTNGDVYKQAAGSWGSPIANLTGPQGSAGVASGSDTQVQFNDGGVFAGDTGLTYNKTTNNLTVTGTVSAANLSGNNTGDQDLSSYAHTADIPTDNAQLTNGAGYVAKTDSSISGAGWLLGSVSTVTDKAVSPNGVKSYVDANAVPQTRTVAGHALSADVTIAAADLTATGIASTKYLRGDNTWQTPTNTTYSAMSVAEGEAGTATTSRTVRADYLEQIINYYVQNALTAMNTDVQYGWPVPL